MFGAGGGTSSYREIEETEVILLWGSNARETHPIFFHHLLKGIHNGARLYAVDPRRTSSARWADAWLGLDVGSDIALANAVGREIIAAGLENREFIASATAGFESYRKAVEPYTLAYAEEETGVPADTIREMAHAYARAGRAMLCWTLGITEHHNAVDNVFALINLALLTGHVGRYGSGINPLRGQNNVQGGGDMGALPDRFPGFQHVEVDEVRAKFERRWGVTLPSERGWHISEMFEAMERGELRALYVLGENPLQSEADQVQARHRLESLDFMVVQDIFLTRTAEMADVVFPASAGWCESDGTVTNSERRVQRVRKALEPPAGARDDVRILFDLARRMGHDWGEPVAEEIWDEVRALSPPFAGMSYARLEAEHGLQWPCYDEDHPGELFLHSRLWERPINGPRVAFQPVEHDPPVERLTDEFPLRLTTGVGSTSTTRACRPRATPRRCGGARASTSRPRTRTGWGSATARWCASPRGAGGIEVPVRIDEGLRPGLTFMTPHFQDEVATNILTIDATDPRSGTAEFKAAAIRVERLGAR